MDGAASTRITISQGTDREKLNFGQDGDTELPFSISAWVFIKDVADTAGIIAAISDRQDGSPNVGKHQFLFQHGHPGSLSAILYDCDGDSVKIDHDDDPATPVQYRFGTSESSKGHGARIRATTNQNVLTNNTWHFVTITYDGSKTKAGLFIYVDAVDRTAIRTKSNDDGPGAPGAPKFIYTRMRDTAVPLTIGNGSANFADLPFENNMADVCIFNKALTLAEVQEIYNGGKVKNMVNASTYNNLISWWKMGDDKDQPGSDGIRDYVGVNHGTLENTAAIRESLDLGTDLEPNPATAGIHIHQSFGRTRGPKNELQYTQKHFAGDEKKFYRFHFQEAIANAHAVVTHNSTASTDSCIRGIPTFCTSDLAICWDVCNKDLNKIETPEYTDRTQWVHDLGYKMWSIKEIRDGTVYKRFKSKLGL